MYGIPMFDLKDPAGILLEIDACRKTFPNHYVRVTAFDATRGWETPRMSFIVNRPAHEPGFRLRAAGGGRARRPLHDRTLPANANDRSLPGDAVTEWAQHPCVARGGRAPKRRARVDLASIFADAERRRRCSQQLDRELVGLAPVKTRIGDIAALLLVERARTQLGAATRARRRCTCRSPAIPGTGKTTVALRMAEILHRLGYVRRGHLVAVTRDDLVGQYIGHTAPKTREVLKKAMGGVLFIDEAYYLYRPENERDYGQEAIEILLQVMENQRDDLVVIFAGYKDRMDTFFRSQPRASRRASPTTSTSRTIRNDELLEIAERMLAGMQYRFSAEARAAFAEYIALRRAQPNFANARSIRNALDRARLRQATRLFASRARHVDRDTLMTIEADDIRKSRVFEAADPRRAMRANDEEAR